MTNPFPTQKGFGLRVYYTTKVIKEYAQNPHSDSAFHRVHSNRKFDNCFERVDSDALVYAIMAIIHERGDDVLWKGVKAMGTNLAEKWNNHYLNAKQQQLFLFED